MHSDDDTGDVADDDTGGVATVYAKLNDRIRKDVTETGKITNGREKAMKDSNFMRKKLAEEQGLKVKRDAVFAEMAPFNADMLMDWFDENAHTTPTKKFVATSRPISPAAPAARAVMYKSNPEGRRDHNNSGKGSKLTKQSSCLNRPSHERS